MVEEGEGEGEEGGGEEGEGGEEREEGSGRGVVVSGGCGRVGFGEAG